MSSLSVTKAVIPAAGTFDPGPDIATPNPDADLDPGTTYTAYVKGGKKGVYRIVLAGTPDHYVTLRLSPSLTYAVAGHPTFMHGHGNMLKKAFIYVPRGTSVAWAGSIPAVWSMSSAT